jgi:ERCC4-type nuclease
MSTAAPSKYKLPLEPSLDSLVAVVDSREQNPLDLSPLRTITGGLATGDYSLRGLERIVSIERKSLSDLLGCVGGERERFDREVQRLLAYPVRAVVVEAHWSDLLAGNWRGKITPAAAVGSVLGWVACGLPILFVGDHANAGQVVSRMLYIAARRRWREARALVGGVLNPAQTEEDIAVAGELAAFVAHFGLAEEAAQ